MTVLYLLWALSAGCGSGFQSGINGSLGKKVGIWEANAINMSVGSLILLVIVIVFAPGELAGMFAAPLAIWLINALLPTCSLTGNIFCAPRLGTGTTAICQAVGSFTMGLILDAVGLFGVVRVSINPMRVIGIGCMIVGLFFVHILYHRNRLAKEAQEAASDGGGAAVAAAAPAATDSRAAFMALMIPVGALGALVSLGQTALRSYTGAWGANFWSFFLSALTGIVMSFVMNKGKGYKEFKSLKPYQLIGGLFGIYGIFMAVTVLPILGTAAMLVARQSGTILITMVIDHFGLMSMPKYKFNSIRATGLGFMILGIVFVSGLI